MPRTKGEWANWIASAPLDALEREARDAGDLVHPVHVHGLYDDLVRTLERRRQEEMRLFTPMGAGALRARLQGSVVVDLALWESRLKALTLREDVTPPLEFSSVGSMHQRCMKALKILNLDQPKAR